EHRRDECISVSARRRKRHRAAAERRELAFLGELVEKEETPGVAEEDRVLLGLVRPEQLERRSRPVLQRRQELTLRAGGLLALLGQPPQRGAEVRQPGDVLLDV